MFSAKDENAISEPVSIVAETENDGNVIIKVVSAIGVAITVFYCFI